MTPAEIQHLRAEVELLRAEVVRKDGLLMEARQLLASQIAIAKDRDRLRAELEAYKKAKAENDERFQLEASTLRAEVDRLDKALEAWRLSYQELDEKLAIAREALQELQLNHEHNESNPDCRIIGDDRFYCCACSTKVNRDEDTARDALKQIAEKEPGPPF